VATCGASGGYLGRKMAAVFEVYLQNVPKRIQFKQPGLSSPHFMWQVLSSQLCQVMANFCG
jgi:hypothetical protein